MLYNLERKTGFKSFAPVVAVYTEDYEPFYVMNKKADFITFNLPKGKYIIETPVERLKRPINYRLPKLPKIERNIKRPSTIQIVFLNNPNKCSIDLEKGLIMCDWSIKAKSRSEQCFVMYHELGHYFYKTESSCDLYAAKRMLEEGFNPSQCYFSVNGCLSERSSDRKETVLNFAKQVKK